MEDWSIAAQFGQWALRGHPVRLTMVSSQMEKLSPAEKLALRDFALKRNVQLVVAEEPTFGKEARPLAMVTTETNSCHAWVSREAEPRLPGPAWGLPTSHPVARGDVSISKKFTAINLDTLLPAPGAQLIQIGSELDCNLADFGARAAKIFVELLTKCASWPRSGIARATYQDSFVSSPLNARLLVDTISQIFLQSGTQDATLQVETRPSRSNEQRSQPWQIGHDWRDPADQKAVIEQLGRQKGILLSLVHKNVPHGRYLTIDFRDGGRATIVLDQGFGAWTPPPHVPVRYDFSVGIPAQVKRLETINAVIQRRGTGKTYLVATSS